MKFRELERLLIEDGWVLKDVRGSHYQYIHPSKAGKVTVPRHPGDLAPAMAKLILKQAGLQNR